MQPRSRPARLPVFPYIVRFAPPLLWCCHASAQTAADTSHPKQAAALTAAEQWSFSASLYAYFPHDSKDYLQPTLSADHSALHFEARYNYEALDAGSGWLGYNFSGAGTVEWEFSPMLGVVFGKLTAVAPGYRGSVRWRTLELYSEGEYVIDTADSSSSFFGSWSELTVGILERMRVGLVTQRTRAYQSDRDVQRGLLMQYSLTHVDLSGYVFNPDEGTPTVVVALRVSW